MAPGDAKVQAFNMTSMPPTNPAMPSSSGPSASGSPAAGSADFGGRPPLERLCDGRMIAGVASGVARFLDLDVTIVRVAFVVLFLFGGAGLPLYLGGWLLLPDETTKVSVAHEVLGHRRAA